MCKIYLSQRKEVSSPSEPYKRPKNITPGENIKGAGDIGGGYVFWTPSPCFNQLSTGVSPVFKPKFRSTSSKSIGFITVSLSTMM